MDGGHSHRKFHSLSLGSRDSLDRACLESESVACDAWSLSIILVSKRGGVGRKARGEDLIDFRGACRFRDPGKTGSSRAISSERMLRVGTNRARTLWNFPASRKWALTFRRDRVDRESTPRENCVCDKKKEKKGKGKKKRNETKPCRYCDFFYCDLPTEFIVRWISSRRWIFIPGCLRRGNRNRSVNIEVTFFPRKVTLKWSTIAHRARHLIHSSIEQKKLGIAFVGTKEAKKEARFILGIDRGWRVYNTPR